MNPACSARVMQQLFGVASEGLYSLMTSRMRVPTELPEGFGDHAVAPIPLRLAKCMAMRGPCSCRECCGRTPTGPVEYSARRCASRGVRAET